MIKLSTPQDFDPSSIRGGEADVDAVFPSGVRVGRTSYGLGLFSFAFIPAGTPIGRVFGTVIDDEDYSSDYCIDVGDNYTLEPASPFCYMNHSCEPNCVLMHYVPESEQDGTEIEGNVIDEDEIEEDDEDECVFSEECGDELDDIETEEDDDGESDDEESAETPDGDSWQTRAEIWVESLRDIMPGEELTIDYSWSSDRAVKCFCGSKNCRGWVVAPSELENINQEAE